MISIEDRIIIIDGMLMINKKTDQARAYILKSNISLGQSSWISSLMTLRPASSNSFFKSILDRITEQSDLSTKNPRSEAFSFTMITPPSLRLALACIRKATLSSSFR